MYISKNVTRTLSAWLVFFVCAGVQAQQEKAVKSATMAVKPARVAYFIDATVLDMGDLLPPPAAVGSAANDAELAELHRIEQTRTPEQVAQAKADDAEEDMFVFKTVLGPNFTPAALPLTAALGEHVKNEQGIVGAQLKSYFQRPRPYQTDATLHPVCELTQAHNAYPSGHSLTGYLEAFTLAEMIPEKRQEILERADEYAYNRMVCGVHYRSDIEASRRASYAVFGYMLATPRFQRELAAARAEMRAKLNLAENKN
jgi:acid phosphatase (class A)